MNTADRERLLTTIRDACAALHETEAAVGKCLSEVAALKIRPRVDYTRGGVALLHTALVAARAFSDRANAADMTARTHRAVAEVSWKNADFAYQQVYDQLSVETTRSDDRHSWEERASRIRTLALDAAILRHEAEIAYLLICGTVDAVATRARGLDRASLDLGRQTDVLKFAHQLAELP